MRSCLCFSCKYRRLVWKLNCNNSNFIFIFWTNSVNFDCRMFGLFYFGQFLFKYKRVCFRMFLNSDRDITISGLINSYGGILELLKGCIISKRIRIFDVFCTLKAIDFIHSLFLSYRLSWSGWKTLLYAGLSIFAVSFTTYCSVSFNLRKSRGGWFASTYRLPTGEVRKASRHNRSPWWWIALSDLIYEDLADPYIMQR